MGAIFPSNRLTRKLMANTTTCTRKDCTRPVVGDGSVYNVCFKHMSEDAARTARTQEGTVADMELAMLANNPRLIGTYDDW